MKTKHSLMRCIAGIVAAAVAVSAFAGEEVVMEHQQVILM